MNQSLNLKEKKYQNRKGRKFGKLFANKPVIESLCPICNESKIENVDFTVAHIISLNKGGSNRTKNLFPCCAHCNSSMGTMNLIEYTKQEYEDSLNHFIFRNFI